MSGHAPDRAYNPPEAVMAMVRCGPDLYAFDRDLHHLCHIAVCAQLFCDHDPISLLKPTGRNTLHSGVYALQSSDKLR